MPGAGIQKLKNAFGLTIVAKKILKGNQLNANSKVLIIWKAFQTSKTRISDIVRKLLLKYIYFKFHAYVTVSHCLRCYHCLVKLCTFM